MLIKPYVTLFFLLSLATVSAQNLRTYERAGDDAFQQKDYGAAVQHYSVVLERDDNNLNVWWKYGESARLYSAYPEAEKAYSKIIVSPKAHAEFPMVDYRLGEVKKSLGDYESAAGYFEKFLQQPPLTASNLVQKVQQELDDCRYAQTVAPASSAVTIKHLGKEVNSPYSDFAPIVVGDTLFFSSYRFDQKGGRKGGNQKLTRVMISSKGGRAREPGRGFPVADTAHVAHTAFSPDGHYIFFTVCKNINANDIRCELWLTVLDRRNRWLPPVRLPEPVNMPGYTSTQPSIGYDEKFEGPVLWFSSDRPGGRGKLDLWYMPLDTNFFCPCNLPLPGKKIIHLPKFDAPKNAVALNTAENDGTPFFYSKTQQLYFSSEGWPGMGGYDIFSAQKKGNDIAPPENAGPGLNTSYNDLYFYLKNDGQNGYLSSNRPGSFYLDEENKACCNDIFSFHLPEPVLPPAVKQPEVDPLESLTAKTSLENPPPAPPLTVKPPGLDDFKGLPLYFDNDEPDKRTRRINTQKTYEETVLDYLERQREYDERFATGLKGSKQDQAEALVDDFFENEVRRGYDRLGQLCDLLWSRLQEGRTLEVMIKGFTSPRAETDYNLNLGKRRISSVRNQFAAYADGVLVPYLRSGQLKVTQISFGETTARHDISDKITDERNSVYHPDAARERRVEIVEIRAKN